MRFLATRRDITRIDGDLTSSFLGGVSTLEGPPQRYLLANDAPSAYSRTCSNRLSPSLNGTVAVAMVKTPAAASGVELTSISSSELEEPFPSPAARV